MTVIQWIELGIGGPLLIAFIVFAFRQGEKVKPSGKEPDASDAITLSLIPRDPP